MVKDKKECTNCDECKKYQDKAFELEVDEDLQQERLDRFWKKYRLWIYTAIFVLLAGTAGVQIYQSHQLKQRLKESDAFENAVIQLYAHQEDAATEAFKNLSANAKTGYKYLAELELAGMAARSQKTEDALPHLKAVMESNAPKALRDVATLSYIGHQVDFADPQQLLDQLEPLMDNPAFIGMTAELVTILYLRQNQKDQARAFLEKAKALPNLSALTQNQLQTLTQIVENQ